MKNIHIFLGIILLFIILYYIFLKEDFEITDNGFVQDSENENIIPNFSSKYKKNNINNILNDSYFTEDQFHKDYIDIINIFNDWDGISPHDKQLFNINNIPITINKNPSDDEINKVQNILKEFIDSVNQKISTNHELYNNHITNGWNTNKYEQNYEDGFNKVQKYLGLTETLYNKEIKGTKVYIIDFFNLEIYSTEKSGTNIPEIKYILYVTLSRELSNDQMIIKINFVEDTSMLSNIIIENIDIIGFKTNKKIKNDYIEINKFYNFDSLNENNMVNTNDILNELAYKHMLRNNLMQEQIDNLSPDDQYTHATLHPQQSQSYKNTRTIYQDIKNAKIFKN